MLEKENKTLDFDPVELFEMQVLLIRRK